MQLWSSIIIYAKAIFVIYQNSIAKSAKISNYNKHILRPLTHLDAVQM
jgi:hypothetical protein